MKQKYRFHELYLKKTWGYNTGAVLLALASLALVLVTDTAWGVTGAFVMWCGVFFEALGIGADYWKMYGGRLAMFNFWTHQASITNLGIIFGALGAVLLAGEFKIKKLKDRKNIAAGLLGGFLMGIGARFAFGCNIGAFFSALPNFSLQGWFFLPSMFIGCVLGGWLLKKYFMAGGASVSSGRRAKRRGTSPQEQTRALRNQVSTGIILLVLILFLGLAIQTVNPMGAWVLFIGFALGYILQRSRFCFTAAFRDPTLTGITDLTKAVIVGLSVLSVVFLALHINITGFRLEYLGALAALPGSFAPVGVQTLIGAIIFGMGAVIAGGCASGTLMRVGEGYSQLWIALLTFILGSGVGAYLVGLTMGNPVLFQLTPIYLPQLLGGWIPTIIVHFGLLFGLYVLADWWGKKKAAETGGV